MKKFLMSLFYKKSVVVIATVCASAAVTTAVIIPSVSKNDENQSNSVAKKNVSQIQDKIDNQEKVEDLPNEDEKSNTEETSSLESKKPSGVIVDSSKVAYLYQNSNVTTSESTSNDEDEKSGETQSTVESNNQVSQDNENFESSQTPSVTEQNQSPSKEEQNKQVESEKTPIEQQTPSVTQQNQSTQKEEQQEPEEIEKSKEEQQTPSVTEPSVTEQNQSPSTESDQNESEESETKPEEQQTPSVTEPSVSEQDQSTSTEKDQNEPEESETKPEEQPQTPTEPQEPEQSPVAPQTPNVEENTDKSSEYIEIVQNAVKKTLNADSVYFTRRRTGLYPENSKIRYNKSQNRNWYINEDIEEYLEGFPGRYTTEFNPVRYFYQTWWSRNKETNLWERRTPLHSVFGISELGFLAKIKSVEKLDIHCPYGVYTVTLDQTYANKAGENLLNTPNMFNKDVTITVMIDFDGYIRSIDCNWGKDVLNNPALGPVVITVHMGDFNSTTIDRPKDLNDSPIDYPDVRNELTPNKKENIKSSIYEAYEKTYKANSATYELNGDKVKYDLQSNSAIREKEDGTITYYDGEDNKYVDHNYVTPEFHQDSWTKAKDSDIWVKNVKKHNCFIPRELYFLRLIFDVASVEEQSDGVTYTIEVLKQYANQAYSYSYDESNDVFSSNITFTVTIGKDGYIKEIHINSEEYNLDLVISDVNNTKVERPEGIE